MYLNPLLKSTVILLLLGSFFPATAQEIHSIGLFTGISSPYTFDGGFNKDPRYGNKYSAKFTPIGFHYGFDLDGYGITIDPQINQMGQNFIIINTVGGHVGQRNRNLTYLQIPVGFKLHMIDLSFFKVSFVAAGGIGLLLNGEETVTHTDSKLFFPAASYPYLPDEYTIVYDGVLVPNVQEKIISNKRDFKSLQIFGALGLRSDWDLSESWRISFDVRGTYGFLEPRSSDYVKDTKESKKIYTRYGNRKELFLAFNIGVSRTIEVSPHDKKRNNGVIIFKGRGKGKKRN